MPVCVCVCMWLVRPRRIQLHLMHRCYSQTECLRGISTKTFASLFHIGLMDLNLTTMCPFSTCVRWKGILTLHFKFEGRNFSLSLWLYFVYCDSISNYTDFTILSIYSCYIIQIYIYVRILGTCILRSLIRRLFRS